ncbi:hypothetical protein PF005_g8800 [Phytophthora fragariae]|nr:hypothetical protein PF003_g16917 [Phytophthora fragariae]KAE8966784.1 hypothetical protein PF011_g27813 [Phytophthora fragariae]KAE9142560.1 hypothetical protein PF006_g12336 [Phytophthora fragariae]KAE9172162.1 hypothetical protein PF002_g29637 [Phytophthora fragariae]KAE9217076.1 hypothetical protein PF005_g8800 [Phytophthora fragariae]
MPRAFAELLLPWGDSPPLTRGRPLLAGAAPADCLRAGAACMPRAFAELLLPLGDPPPPTRGLPLLAGAAPDVCLRTG